MKILIISDTHRKHENLLKVLERECPVDLLIHLGDAEGYEDYIAEQAGCPVEVVAGNNDFFPHCHGKKSCRSESIKCLLPMDTTIMLIPGLKILSAKQKEEDVISLCLGILIVRSSIIIRMSLR